MAYNFCTATSAPHFREGQSEARALGLYMQKILRMRVFRGRAIRQKNGENIESRIKTKDCRRQSFVFTFAYEGFRIIGYSQTKVLAPKNSRTMTARCFYAMSTISRSSWALPVSQAVVPFFQVLFCHAHILAGDVLPSPPACGGFSSVLAVMRVPIIAAIITASNRQEDAQKALRHQRQHQKNRRPCR